MKKLLALTLTLLMVLSVAALAAQDKTADGQMVIVTTANADLTGKTVILHSNDVHGAISGYAYMAGLRAQMEAAGAEVIVVDCGDFSQGDIYVSTTKGATAVDMMNAAGYDVVTLGNHEFDFGYAQLMENLSKAQFKTLCADVTLDETGEPILDASTIVETASGLKIGFIGMETPETASKVNPGLITEISFKTFDDLYASCQSAIDSVREDSDLVIGLFHLGVDAESAANGNRSSDVYAKVSGLDFILDGHSHTVMTMGENGEPIQSTGTKFAYIGVVVIDNETKAIVDNYLVPTYDVTPDADVAALAEETIAAVDEAYGAVFAKSEVLLNGEKAPGNRTEETNMGDLICDAMVWSVVKQGGFEQFEPNQVVGITNGGGIRAAIEVGDISMKDINTVLPFGNTVAVVYVTGNQLLEVLEASTFCTPEAIGGYPQTSGIQWTLDTSVEYDQGDLYIKPDGKETTYYAPKSIGRVTITAINGEPFDPEATYAVVTNNFCSAGGDTYNVFGYAYLDGGFDTGIPMDQAVMDYIAVELEGVVSADQYAEPQGRLTEK